MDRYKFIDTENNIVAVMDETEIKYVTCLTEGGPVTFCKDKRFALGVKINGKIYALNKAFKNYPVVATKIIDLFEYEKLKTVLTKGVITEEEASVEIIDKDTSTLQLYKNRKLKELSAECKNKIVNGITIIVSGKEEHFDLSIEDQLNLQSLRFAIIQGEEEVAFHSKGNTFRYFTKEEALQILEATDDFILYHNSYFNSARTYIESLFDIAKVNAFKYGDEIPEEYMSQVLKDFVKV